MRVPRVCPWFLRNTIGAVRHRQSVRDPSCFCESDFGRKDCPSQHHNRRLERHCMEEQMLSHDGVLLLFLFHLYEVYLCLTLCNWTCSWRLYLERNHTQYCVFKLKFTTGSIETGSLASLSEWVVLCWRIIKHDVLHLSSSVGGRSAEWSEIGFSLLMISCVSFVKATNIAVLHLLDQISLGWLQNAVFCWSSTARGGIWLFTYLGGMTKWTTAKPIK